MGVKAEIVRGDLGDVVEPHDFPLPALRPCSPVLTPVTPTSEIFAIMIASYPLLSGSCGR
jgi:hypothetical protein